jgi:hypothetical protein
MPGKPLRGVQEDLFTAFETEVIIVGIVKLTLVLDMAMPIRTKKWKAAINEQVRVGLLYSIDEYAIGFLTGVHH